MKFSRGKAMWLLRNAPGQKPSASPRLGGEEPSGLDVACAWLVMFFVVLLSFVLLLGARLKQRFFGAWRRPATAGEDHETRAATAPKLLTTETRKNGAVNRWILFAAAVAVLGLACGLMMILAPNMAPMWIGMFLSGCWGAFAVVSWQGLIK